jgi:hypothetical protein
MKGIVDPRTGAWLFPHQVIATVLYATWNDENYREHLKEVESKMEPNYWKYISEDNKRIMVCEEKAEELFKKF